MGDFAPEEFSERLQRLQSLLAGEGADLALVTENADLYYFTGSVQPAYLAVPAAGAPVLLARKALARIAEEAGALALEAFTGTRDLQAALQRHGLAGARRLGLTLDTLSYASVLRLQRLFPGAEPVDLSWGIRMLRAVHSPAEIALQARAGAVMGGIPDLLRAAFRPGMTELELSAEIERYLRRHEHGALLRVRREGGELAASGACTAGANALAGSKFDSVCVGKGLSPAVPYGATADTIAPGAPVMIDFGMNLRGYTVDQTRMFSWGAPAAEVTAAYEAMVQIEQAALAGLVPGRPWQALYGEAVALAARLGYAESFMGLGPEKVRFLGHGVGLELDEPPFLAPGMEFPLAEGMVVAVEPKVALPGVGVVGIEDTVVVRAGSPEVLTTAGREWITVE